jgi:UDP-N-acetylglucosamine/UDP-N-acetylgalactosamine diphosphorylase
MTVRHSDPQKQELIDLLYKENQQHVLRFWDRLNEPEQHRLLEQVAAIDFSLLNKLYRQSKEKDENSTPRDLEEPDVITLAGRRESDAAAIERGEKALRTGEVAAVLVAGGQATRMGIEIPKGAFPITPVKEKSLFQLHAEKLLAIARRYGKPVPWYIMTSETNNDATIAFFEENNYFGYDKNDLFFFVQEMIAALDADGNLILDRPGHIFTNPNGHGGTLQALYHSGALADMRKRGIRSIFYFQVDNGLNPLCDPAFIGYHLQAKADMSSKVLTKRNPEEKVGIICKVGGKVGVVEYSDISKANMYATRPDGSLKFSAGSIAIHMIDVEFALRENKGGFKLPYHIANKVIPYIDDAGKRVVPAEKNGIKFETFVFDALHDAANPVTLEVDRSSEFSALKNNTGEDSPQTVYRDLCNYYGQMLMDAGAEVPRDAEGNVTVALEISPLYALDSRELKSKGGFPEKVAAALYLGD